MRFLPLLALLTVASAHAQARLELVDPLLLLDGQRTSVAGPPLVTTAFSQLEMEIPGMGLLLVSDAPFEDARRAGDFDGTRLVLVVDGRSLRLRSQAPILNATGPVPAYARLDANPLTPTQGPVTLRLLNATAEPPPRTIARPTPDTLPAPPVSDPTVELTRQLEALREERDRLRMALAEAELERDDAQLRLAALREDVERLRNEISGARMPENQLRAERDALHDEVQRLRASLAALGTPATQPVGNPVADPTVRVTLPDFDVTRLRNADQIEARLRAITYPAWADASGIGGDVLVLFQTDTSGAVVRTAVPRPIGGGLDALAEEIVQAMRFVPVRADGQPTRLRSQVVVRFRP